MTFLQPAYLKFLVLLLAFSLLPVWIVSQWPLSLPAKFYTPYGWMLLVAFIGVTALLHAGFLWALEKGSKQFIRFYMAAAGAKMLVFLFTMLVFALFNRKQAPGFIFLSGILYVFYTFFETLVAIRLSRMHRERP